MIAASAGNRARLRKRDGSVLAYLYDQLDRLIRKTVPERVGLSEIHTPDVFYDYNVRDLMTDARFDSWSGEGVGYNYDGFGRMISSSLNLDNDGGVFHNRESRLPNIQGVTYREYVHPTPGVGGPAAQRIVIGSNGVTYYTADHYLTFFVVR